MKDTTAKAPTLVGFINFVNAQLPHERIDHGRGWCNCAVGEYVAMAIGAPDSTGQRDWQEEFARATEQFANHDLREHPPLETLLNCKGDVRYALDCLDEDTEEKFGTEYDGPWPEPNSVCYPTVDTYGHLQEFLRVVPYGGDS